MPEMNTVQSASAGYHAGPALGQVGRGTITDATTEAHAVALGSIVAEAGDPVLVSTFGRSGTHLVIDLIRRNFPAFRSWKLPLESTEHLYAELGSAVRGLERLAITRRRLLRPARPLIKTHEWDAMLADPATRRSPLVRAIRQRGQVVEVIRHPEPAIQSWYALDIADSLRLKSPMAEDIDAYIERRASEWAAYVRQREASRTDLLLRFEQVRADPAGAIRQIALATGALATPRTPILPPAAPSLLAARIARLTRIKPASTAIIVRRDIRAACRFEWTPRRKAVLRALAGAEMRDLGY